MSGAALFQDRIIALALHREMFLSWPQVTRVALDVGAENVVAGRGGADA